MPTRPMVKLKNPKMAKNGPYWKITIPVHKGRTRVKLKSSPCVFSPTTVKQKTDLK